MPYFPDLSPYTFLTPKEQVSPSLLNVGWLSRGHSFPKGAVDQRIVEELLSLCRTRVRLTRGFHRCEFCGVFPMFMMLEGEQISLGNGEIRVCGANGKTYAAPTMICHYIDKHE